MVVVVVDVVVVVVCVVGVGVCVWLVLVCVWWGVGGVGVKLNSWEKNSHLVLKIIQPTSPSSSPHQKIPSQIPFPSHTPPSHLEHHYHPPPWSIKSIDHRHNPQIINQQTTTPTHTSKPLLPSHTHIHNPTPTSQMFSAKLVQRVAQQRVATIQTRKMGGHGPSGHHIWGTRQADYIQQHNIYNELMEQPGKKRTMNEATYHIISYLTMAAIGVKIGYSLTKPVRVDLDKVTVTHPDSGEEVFLFKPTAIHKDWTGAIFGMDLVKAPRFEYTRQESSVAEQMALYNDEMDFWLTHGKDSEAKLGRPFKLFDPVGALVTDRQDPERFRPANI